MRTVLRRLLDCLMILALILVWTVWLIPYFIKKIIKPRKHGGDDGMSKKQRIDHVVWTNRKVRHEVQLLSGASALILSLVIIWRFAQGEIQAHTAFGIGLGFGMILALLLLSMAPMILVKKLEGGDAIEE